MRPFGLFLTLVLLAVPAFYFFPLSAQHNSSAIFSQYIGVTALIAMGLSQVLSTRFRILETLFGGLDQIYVLHKWLGIGALAAVLLHDTVDAELDGLGGGFPFSDTAETLGEISLYGILALVLITVITFIPYPLWRFSHRLMGGFFTMAALHFAFIEKPFANTDPLGLYVLTFCVLGVVSYIYTQLPTGLAARHRRYRVKSVEASGEAVAVELALEETGIKHRAGQFAFVGFDNANLSEIHPFTISSAPNNERTIRFTIKPLGDYTARIQHQLKVDSVARISPAYGHFEYRNSKTPQIWIAGGIGITPFLAWANSLVEMQGPVHLFYCVSERKSAAHLAEVEALASQHANLHLHLIESAVQGRLTAEGIRAAADIDLDRTKVYFCGSEPMRDQLKAGLIAAGLNRRRFIYEAFEIRSGIGIRKLLGWLLTKLGTNQRLRQVLRGQN